MIQEAGEPMPRGSDYLPPARVGPVVFNTRSMYPTVPWGASARASQD
jgi:hypothetical protein